MKLLMENLHVVEAGPEVDGSSYACGDFVTFKNANRITVMVHVSQRNAAVVDIGICQATNLEGSDKKPISVNVPIFANQDIEASDTLVRQPDGVGFVTSATIKDKMVIFETDAWKLDLANGFCCVAVNAKASNQANLLSARYMIAGQRYFGKSANTE